jgi:hypothetical protein
MTEKKESPQQKPSEKPTQPIPVKSGRGENGMSDIIQKADTKKRYT